MSSFKIMVLSHDKKFYQQLKNILNKLELYYIDNLESIKTLPPEKIPDLIINDLSIYELSNSSIHGYDVVEKIKSIFDRIPFIAIIKEENVPAADLIFELKVLAVLKSVTDPMLEKLINGLIIRKDIIKNLIPPKTPKFISETGMNLIVQNQEMKSLYRIAEKYASTNNSILILGETGTGKELMAEFIHRKSKRKENIYFSRNAASYTPELFDSLFFGHVKGAFTGALRNKRGDIEEADKGTFFLDEIADLDTVCQTKLLRFLENGKFNRVGENDFRTADVRMIFATNKNPGNLREDFYYRINQSEILLPPLRERKDEILPLSDFFLKSFNLENERILKGFTKQAYHRLHQYKYPGNIRELKSIIENAAAVANRIKF